MLDENEETSKSIFSEAILLAVIPGVAYGMAYLYQSAFCKVYSIPTALIDISTSSVLAIVFGLCSFLVVPFFFIDAFYKHFAEVGRSAITRAIGSVLRDTIILTIILILLRPTVSWD